MNYVLTKSKFCHGQVCPKRLWMMHNKQEEATEPSDYEDWISQQGDEVEKLAQSLFTSATLIDRNKQSWSECVNQTERLLKEKSKTLFQPAFCVDEVLIFCDILDRQIDGTYHLYEVKSFADIKKKIKKNEHDNFYINDLLIQIYVLTKYGLRVSKASIMYINKEYHRGDDIDADKLFAYYYLSDKDLKRLTEIPQKIKTLKNILAQKKEYQHEMGSYCKNPFDCIFKEYCLNLLPNDSLRKTNIFHWSTRDKLISEGQDRLSSLKLDDERVRKRLPAIHAELDKKDFIDYDALTQILEKFAYPLYFLDFECARYPIPRYQGQKPYELVPFQFSLHVLPSKEGNLEHCEFLYDIDADPAEQCAKQLCDLIKDTGSIVAFHSSYERDVLKHLANKFNDGRQQLNSFISRLLDLEIPFKSKEKICYIPGSMGYSSIKTILPLLFPEDDYTNLEVKSGDQAMVMYWMLIHSVDGIERQDIIDKLKKYCAQDTFSMVKIYNWLYVALANCEND